MKRFDQPAPRVAGPRDRLRRLTRWLNLTAVHQAAWPVLVLLAGDTMRRPAESSTGEVLGMAVCPLIAALIAVGLIRGKLGALPAVPVHSVVADQVRLIALGLPVMVFLARFVFDDASATWKIGLVGAANVAAYHLIHFGVVRSMFPHPATITGLFGVSWAVHQIADSLARDTGGSYALHALSGFSVGVVVAAVAQVLHRWPGGRLTAPAAHWLVIYLIFGFST
jgi:hypothetical protein